MHHFTPANDALGQQEATISSEGELRKQVNARPTNQKLNTLVIYGNENLKINNESGLLKLKPKKIVLTGGAQITNGPNSGIETGLYNQLISHPKWRSGVGRHYAVVSVNFDEGKAKYDDLTGYNLKKVTTLQEALDHKPPRQSKNPIFHPRAFFKRKHFVYEVVDSGNEQEKGTNSGVAQRA